MPPHTSPVSGSIHVCRECYNIEGQPKIANVDQDTQLQVMSMLQPSTVLVGLVASSAYPPLLRAIFNLCQNNTKLDTDIHILLVF